MGKQANVKIGFFLDSNIFMKVVEKEVNEGLSSASAAADWFDHRILGIGEGNKSKGNQGTRKDWAFFFFF